MSKTHYIRQVQTLPVPVEEAWEFFSNPENLVKITPASLDFRILSDITEKEIHAGQLIHYKVRPLFNVPLKWLTEITKVEKHHSFVDEQRKGPYKLWRHEHQFRAIATGTEMLDIVAYQVPFGFLGVLALPIVRKQLSSIFDYRRRKIEAIFGNFNK